MSKDYLENMDELELEFTKELKGYGSLKLHLAPSADGGTGGGYIGFDIRPEDIESLYFEGIGTPRWESITADSVPEQLKLYNESMDRVMADYPQIKRVNDTDKTVAYSSDEVAELRSECERVIENTTDEKAIRASQKFLLACHKANEGGMGLTMVPG